MAYKVVVQGRAERDIAEAFDYIFREAPSAALPWYTGLKSAILSLSEMPARCGMAPESEKLGFELRQLIFGKRTGRYRIVFRILKEIEHVHVLAVRHGARGPLELEDFE